MVVVWLWVGVCVSMVISVSAMLSLNYGGLASVGEEVYNGGVSLQGGCFCVVRRWIW
jgi:hypothetical protein